MTTAEASNAQPLLVALVNNQRDWRRVLEEGWYRLPLAYAPLPAAALYLAFYRSRAFGAEAWRIGHYAPALRYELLRRREIIPDEPRHPRADQLYYRVALGPIRQLARPLPSRRLRRITFIPTTLERLLEAEDVAELWRADDGARLVWSCFPDAAQKATRRMALDLEGDA
jgi:hypothetical protein